MFIDTVIKAADIRINVTTQGMLRCFNTFAETSKSVDGPTEVAQHGSYREAKEAHRKYVESLCKRFNGVSHDEVAA